MGLEGILLRVQLDLAATVKSSRDDCRDAVKYGLLRKARSAMTQRLVLASNNPGKLKEFSQILAPLGFELHPQGEFNVPECEEPFSTFVENALEKARHAARLTGLPALADDSGVCVNALGGAPGVWSARYAGEPKSDTRNNQKVIADLDAHADKFSAPGCKYCNALAAGERGDGFGSSLMTLIGII
jgi:inosine/xanthosine triphosphate pyrophosphatase family protein